MPETPHNPSYDPPNEDINKGRTVIIHTAATAKDQKTPFDPLGVTIVSFVRSADSYPLQSACAQSREARPSFHSFAAVLHLTVLGLLAREQPELEDEQRKQIEQAVIDVMEDVLSQTPQFTVIVQGIWSGGDVKRIGGNVVAAIDEDSRRYIETLGKRLIDELKPRLAKICNKLELHPVEGVKITIGYYDESEDFGVDHNLALALEELRHVETELRVERIVLARFRYKSLENAEIIYEIELPKPANSPIKQVTVKPKVKPKVLVVPHWTRWRGWSYIWDNPGENMTCCPGTELRQIACKAWADSELTLYRGLGNALAKIGLASTFTPYSFCPLPTTSYHVTAWDGIHEQNLCLLSESARVRFARFLLRLPKAAEYAPPDLIPPDAFDGISGVQFKFGSLEMIDDAALVARLVPVDEASARLLERVSEKRKQLDERFAPMGRPPSLDYTPHVSLGYFYSPEAALTAASHLPQWDEVFHQCTAGHRLAPHSISAYAFESMEAFLQMKFA